ncbi:hypothetical protein D7236_08475 [Stutzerimonas stutzeri]|nr:hypothetical protein [Stutzerimonas stutzeri]
MRRVSSPSLDRKCKKCGGEIPQHKRADAAYCSARCLAAVEKARYRERNPDKAKRQWNEWYHRSKFGHTKFLDDPTLNPRDRFRVARSLGFRSLLEYDIARQLSAAGVEAQYEPFAIRYTKPQEVVYAD